MRVKACTGGVSERVVSEAEKLRRGSAAVAVAGGVGYRDIRGEPDRRLCVGEETNCIAVCGVGEGRSSPALNPDSAAAVVVENAAAQCCDGERGESCHADRDETVLAVVRHHAAVDQERHPAVGLDAAAFIVRE